jgi:hypothetical protein
MLFRSSLGSGSGSFSSEHEDEQYSTLAGALVAVLMLPSQVVMRYDDVHNGIIVMIHHCMEEVPRVVSLS